MLKVIRSYLPILIGIAVAAADLVTTHSAPPLPQQAKVVRMETIVVTAQREKPDVALADAAFPTRAAPRQ